MCHFVSHHLWFYTLLTVCELAKRGVFDLKLEETITLGQMLWFSYSPGPGPCLCKNKLIISSICLIQLQNILCFRKTQQKKKNFMCFIVIYTYWSKWGCRESFVLWPEHKMSEKYPQKCVIIIIFYNGRTRLVSMFDIFAFRLTHAFYALDV